MTQVQVSPVSSIGLLSLLEENQNDVKLFALTKLNDLANDHWAEMASSVTSL
jgi:hypothetical protein